MASDLLVDGSGLATPRRNSMPWIPGPGPDELCRRRCCRCRRRWAASGASWWRRSLATPTATGASWAPSPPPSRWAAARCCATAAAPAAAATACSWASAGLVLPGRAQPCRRRGGCLMQLALPAAGRPRAGLCAQQPGHDRQDAAVRHRAAAHRQEAVRAGRAGGGGGGCRLWSRVPGWWVPGWWGWPEAHGAPPCAPYILPRDKSAATSPRACHA